jgi:glycerol-3-phosphate cytidylyltransferase|tara:strand:+ start:5801 stop:6220 length:420 start_codon:yes stop_codon:yes gene_type:complete
MKKYQCGIICGSFDLIHPGYIKMFRDAKSVCQKLTIALQGDPTIDRPEKCKPVQTITDRIEILGSIKYIDRIVVYNTEDDLDQLLAREEYDVRILGTDYRNRVDYTGAHYNIPVYFHERNHEYSTTKLKNQIVESMRDQ